MRAQRLILDLSPSRLTMAIVQRSRILRSHAVELDPARWDDAWKDRLAPLDQPLLDALQALAIKPDRARVHLTFRSESAVAELFSSPAPPRAAQDAARLALESAAPFPLDENASSLTLLHRDGATENPQSHVLALAENAQTLRTLSDWLQRADLILARATPAIAHTIQHALRIALAQPNDQTAAVLLLAEHDAVFLAVSPATATLHFIRQIPVGLETFLAPLARTITRPAPAPPLTLSRDQARRYLLQVGLPPFDAEPEPHTTLTPRETLPLLQPALQRLAVEIKQSLRFGLNDELRENTVLSLTGLASDIPNLEQRLADLAAATTRPLANADDRLTDPIQRAVFADLAGVSLATPEAENRATSRRLIGALYAGSAAASLLLLADAALTARAVNESRGALDAVADAASALVLPDAAPEAQALAAAVAHAAASINDADAQRPDWPALLAELARRLPPSVRILAFSAQSDELLATVEASITQTAGSPSTLRAAIDALQESPLVRTVDLGPTMRDPESGALRVALRVAVWPAPRQPLSAALNNQ